MSPTDGALWLGLVLLLATFARGRRRLLATSGGRRLLAGGVGVAGWIGVSAVVVALSPPFDRLADTLLVAHMGQHLLLLLPAGAGLAVGRVVAVLGAAAPRGLREQRRMRVAGAWTRPLLAAVLLGVVWWGWHVPSLYAATLRLPLLHGAEHASMLAVAWLFWSVVLDAGRRSQPGVAVLAVLATALHMVVMAALLSFTATPWLGEVVDGPLDPLLDQQLAGGLLWFPGGLVWIALGTWLVWRWLREDERHASRAPA